MSSTGSTARTSGIVNPGAIFLLLSEFRDLLEAAATKFPSKQAFAKAIGVTPSRFSRVLSGNYALNVLNCLRLAKLTGDSASRVLRVAGKNEIADLMEELYGRTAPALSPSDRELLDRWNALTPRARESLRGILGDLTVNIDRKPKKKTA